MSVAIAHVCLENLVELSSAQSYWICLFLLCPPFGGFKGTPNSKPLRYFGGVQILNKRRTLAILGSATFAGQRPR